MTRNTDNGFVKGTYGESIKSFKITDIYDEVIYVNNIDVPNAGSSVSADSNFPACGLTTSKYEVNRLDYVLAYPNPFIKPEDVLNPTALPTSVATPGIEEDNSAALNTKSPASG